MKAKQLGFSLCVLLCVLAMGLFGVAAPASAQPKPIKIAVVYPLSGALARNGHLMVESAKAAMKWVNDHGGIKSMGGAKLEPVIADSTSTVEGAASAMERVLRDPDISMVMGCWASSFTMSATEISERIGVPQFSISYAGALSNRGFKYGFYVVPSAEAQARLALRYVIDLARNKGQKIRTAMLVGDDQLASKAFYNPCRRMLPKMGIKIIGEEIWSMGTLTDATAVMQKVKSLHPDIVIFMATAISEAQMCLMKKKELGIDIPFISNGGWAADPSFLQVGAKTLQGMITITPAFPNKLTPPQWIKYSLEQCKKDYSNEPWVGQELGYAWTMVPIMAQILEQAKSRNRDKIREVASKLDIHNVLATRYTVKQGMAFGKNNRIAKKYQGVLLVQWQNGRPICVYPKAEAVAEPIWVTK